MFSENARAKMLRRGFGPVSFLVFFSDSFHESLDNVRRYPRLARSILLFSTGFHVAVLAALIPVYYRATGPDFTELYNRLVAYTALGFAGFTAWMLMYVGLIRDAGGRMRPAVGLANHLTAVRFYLIVPVVVLFGHGLYVASLVVYVVLGLTDIADGIVARRRGEQTEFGVVMDPLADVFSTAAVFAAFLAGGFIPGWLFAILMVRYGMLIVGSFVVFLATGPIRFRATIPGKIVGVIQGIGVIIVVWCLWRGIDWRDNIAPVLFPVLGFVFASIVVSQAVLGYRHLKHRPESGNKAVTLDLEGNLTVFEPISVFQLIHLARSTGELSMDVGDNSARIFFDGGSVTYAEISNRKKKLGEYLVDQKLITQKALDRVLVKNRRGKKLGRLLVEDGAIDENDLRCAIEEQIKEVIYEVVRWRKGWFQFGAGKKPTSQDVFIDIPLDNLMLEGLKRLDEEGDKGA